MADSRWFACRCVSEAAVRLYCFPHSGGAAGEYVRWAGHVRGVEICGLQPPGRGERFAEEPPARFADLVEAIAREARFQEPFAFFGHSLGAIVAYELVRSLRAASAPLPEHLFVSACPAPHLGRRRPPARERSDDELLAEIEALGGPLPPEIGEDPDAVRIAVLQHRADAELLDTYRFEPGEPLDLPVTAVGGAQDDVGRDRLDAWRQHTSGAFQVRLLPGGHFYFRDRPHDLLQVLVDALAMPSRAHR